MSAVGSSRAVGGSRAAGDGNATAPGAVDPDLLTAAEAVLIVTDEPVTPEALAGALGVEAAQAQAVLAELAREYAGAGGGRPRGFVLREGATGWRLASAPSMARVVEDFVVGGATARLSQAALETLAVVAYRQPVTRTQVAAVRGVNVDGVMRTLHARGLVEERGCTPSGAVLYGTTTEFLDLVGVRDLDELPPLAPYLPPGSDLGQIESEALERARGRGAAARPRGHEHAGPAAPGAGSVHSRHEAQV